MCGTHTVEDFKDSGAVHLRYIFDPDRDSAGGGVIFTPIRIIFRGMTCSPFPMQLLQYPSLVYLRLGFLQRFGLIKRRFYNPGRAIMRQAQTEREAVGGSEILLNEIVEAGEPVMLTVFVGA